MDHFDRIKQEFARQADQFAASAAIGDAQHTSRIVDALGEAAQGAILDVACGPGIVTAALAAQARSVVGLDLTPEMLRRAQQRCAQAQLTNVRFEAGNATALPFADNTFDATVTRLSLHHFEQPSLVLGEMCRVLKPAGTCVMADVVSAEDAEDSAVQNAIETIRDPSHVRMLPISELAELVRSAGFSIEFEATWDKSREFEEWVGIVAAPERVAPLRTLVRALARGGITAGMGLKLDGEAIGFFHRWHLIKARKPRS